MCIRDRYENYHDGAPMVQKVIFRVVPEDATRALLIQSKQADVAMRLPATEVNRLKASGGINFVEGETVMTMYVALNNSKGVLQNVKVRQAMNYACLLYTSSRSAPRPAPRSSPDAAAAWSGTVCGG